MSNPNPVTVDPSEYRISRRLFRRMSRLIVPYWRRPGVWRSWGAAGIMAATILVVGYIGFIASFFMRDLTNALIAKQAGAFWRNLLLYAILQLLVFLLPRLMQVAEAWLNQHWRRWLTIHLVDQYLAKRTYYDIALTENLDNPDQRIQECVTPFLTTIVSFPRLILLQAGMMASGIAILITVDSRLILAAIGFGIFQSVLLYFLYVPTVGMNFRQMVAEADLRYGILHVRDNAEAVAFYQGEAAERLHIVRRLDLTVKRNLSLLYYTAGVIGIGQNSIIVLWTLLPYLTLASGVLSGAISYGGFMQASAAVFSIVGAIDVAATFLPTVAAAAPQAVRLAQIQERFDMLNAGRSGRDRRALATMRVASHVALRDVSLETPGGEQQLVQNLTLTVERGEHLVIVGQTGVGKSSLLRAMAGLWDRGSGTIEMPPPRECLFLPQRSYMILDTLRAQLLYPGGDTSMSDDVLKGILRKADLPDLLDKHGGLDAVRDWAKVLSLGEQQRLGFARVLVNKPGYVFLDEATSAVDFGTEERLYAMLRQTGASYISIGHRLSILDHHTHLLTVKAGGKWSLESIEKVGSVVTVDVHGLQSIA